MRFCCPRRWRSASWWGLCLCALLLVGAYVVFDILDVDGSQSRHAPASDMIVEDAPEATAERYFRATLAVSSSTDPLSPLLPRLSAAAQYAISPPGALLRVRHSHARPRVDAAAERARASAPASDPL